MRVPSRLWRPALRCVLIGLALCVAMLVILALEGRVQSVREQLFGTPAPSDDFAVMPHAVEIALPRLAASTSYFTLPAPMDAAKFAALEQELIALRDRQRELVTSFEEREAMIAAREQRCSTWEERLAQVEEELRRTAEKLDLRTAELARDLELRAAAKTSAERRLARTLEEMDPATAAATLAAQADPLDAACVFAHLPADRQAAIAAVFSASERERFWPAWLRVETARQAQGARKPR